MPTNVSPQSFFPRVFRKIGLFPQDNIQVTSGTPKQARSESIIAVNPRDRNNLIAASKKFSNPDTYRFTIGVRVSFDGGWSWQDATLPTLPEWGNMVGIGSFDASAGMTDPAVVFDDFGNAFLVGEPIGYFPGFQFPKDIQTIGMFIYKSTDGGLSWSAPSPLHVGDLDDDKSWITCDNNPTSPHYGNIYVAWGARSPLRFARSTDHGKSWKGIGNETAGSKLADYTFAPEISVGLDGTVHIVWYDGGAATTIEYTRSIDGGETFEQQTAIVDDVQGLGNLPETDRWPHFPDNPYGKATFRVITVATGCAFGFDPLGNAFSIPSLLAPKNFIVAWSDLREGAARIYYKTSSNAGASFDGPLKKSQPLLGGKWVDPSLHHFHPQIVATGSGVIGCAYYEYGPKGGRNVIDVKISASFDKGKTFPYTTIVTDKPWDPAINAPLAHGDQQVTFIGEYFGLDAHDTGFNVLWTDTRTGVQELFYDRIETDRDNTPEILGGISAEILFGVIQGGDGVVVVNGHIIRIPPRGPIYEMAQAMVALDVADKIRGAAGRALTKSVWGAIGAIAKTSGQRG